jgi:hypothetical protein
MPWRTQYALLRKVFEAHDSSNQRFPLLPKHPPGQVIESGSDIKLNPV